MYFYDMGDFQIAGASPEILVRQDAVTGKDGSAQTASPIRPIAGTRPRGKTREQDLQLEADLKADPKECAEHVMLIDLARNDVGRIAQVGTVKVNEQMRGGSATPTVMHLVTRCRGLLKPELSAMDVLRASSRLGRSVVRPRPRHGNHR